MPRNSQVTRQWFLLEKLERSQGATLEQLVEVRLDPWWGFYHRPRHGRPALALDLMEPFRPLIVDSAVVTTVNTGMVKAKDFTTSRSGCMLNPIARKSMIRAYESRMDQLVTHPVFEYRCSWRSMIRVHARLLSRWLRGDIPRFESIVTR
jgi:CRISPR-associated protein Cas1